MKDGHSKIIKLDYSSLEMQQYLKNQQITPTQAKVIFKFRTRMVNLSENFKGGKPTKERTVCNTSTDTQNHSFQCPKINNLKIEGRIDDIF